MPPTKPRPHSDEYVSLRDYFDTRIAALEQATALAREAMEKRLNGMNEFRDTLRDQASRFVTGVEVKSLRDDIQAIKDASSNFVKLQEFRTEIESLCDDIRFLRESRALLEGKASQNSVIVAYLFSLAGLILGIIGLLK